MGNACRSFGFDEDTGMRIFSIVEMFLACHHIIAASFVFRHIVESIYGVVHKLDHQVVIMALGCIFMVTLALQAVLGFLLYLKGWKEKNCFVCFLWISIALTNAFFSMLIVFVEVITGKLIYWSRFFLYLIYVLYGVWVVYSFVKWAKKHHYDDSLTCCKCCVQKDHPDGSNPSIVVVPVTTVSIRKPPRKNQTSAVSSTSASTSQVTPAPPNRTVVTAPEQRTSFVSAVSAVTSVKTTSSRGPSKTAGKASKNPVKASAAVTPNKKAPR